MAKKKSKTKATVIMLSIPDVDSHDGKATLTLQRGELGLMSEFDYKGLTLKGNIAEAVQTALLNLTKVEAVPPPERSAETTEAASETRDESDADRLDEGDSDIDEIEAAASEGNLPAMESASTPMDTSTDDPPQCATEIVPPKVSVSAISEISVIPSDNQQMSLF